MHLSNTIGYCIREMYLIRLLLTTLFFSGSSVQQLQKGFVDLSERCLIMLHLELRCHCFYFLLPAARQVRMHNSCCPGLTD